MSSKYTVGIAQAATDIVLVDVDNERAAQRMQWGVQRHDFAVWGLVLTEEAGEFAKAILRFREAALGKADAESCGYSAAFVGTLGTAEKQRLEEARLEAVQVAAVAVAIVEHIDEELQHYGIEASSAESDVHGPGYRTAEAPT